MKRPLFIAPACVLFTGCYLSSAMHFWMGDDGSNMPDAFDSLTDTETVQDPDIPDSEANLCPDECNLLPAAGEIGAPCVSSSQCDLAICYAESQEMMQRQHYVENYGGQCLRETSDCYDCPAGSRCVFRETGLDFELYLCLDACEPADDSGLMYEFSCGCRPGYRCDPMTGACMVGCSNDRECCERWWDANHDNSRQPEELAQKAGCTNLCDNGDLYDDTSPQPEPCTVSYACINNGDPSNLWGGPCEGDAWCPPDGMCLDEFRYKDWNGTTLYPGGYCIKPACDMVGRGCSEHGGVCLNIPWLAGPVHACLGRCHTNRQPGDQDYECRTAAGQEQDCVPFSPEDVTVLPADGSDGYCWPRSG